MTRIKEICDQTLATFRNCQEVELRERIHAVLLSRDGRTKKEVAEILYRRVEEILPWLKTYKQGGLEALAKISSKPHQAEPSTTTTDASPTQTQTEHNGESPAKAMQEVLPEIDEGPLDTRYKHMIRECLRFSPRIYGRKSRVWTTGALAEVLRRDCGEDVPRDHIRSFLKAAGLARLQSKDEFLNQNRDQTRRLLKMAEQSSADQDEQQSSEAQAKLQAARTPDSPQASPAETPAETPAEPPTPTLEPSPAPVLDAPASLSPDLANPWTQPSEQAETEEVLSLESPKPHSPLAEIAPSTTPHNQGAELGEAVGTAVEPDPKPSLVVTSADLPSSLTEPSPTQDTEEDLQEANESPSIADLESAIAHDVDEDHDDTTRELSNLAFPRDESPASPENHSSPAPELAAAAETAPATPSQVKVEPVEAIDTAATEETPTTLAESITPAPKLADSRPAEESIPTEPEPNPVEEPIEEPAATTESQRFNEYQSVDEAPKHVQRAKRKHPGHDTEILKAFTAPELHPVDDTSRNQLSEHPSQPAALSPDPKAPPKAQLSSGSLGGLGALAALARLADKDPSP